MAASTHILFRSSNSSLLLLFVLFIRCRQHCVKFFDLGLQNLADYPRLYWNVHCTPGTEWLRLTPVEVPKSRLWTANDREVKMVQNLTVEWTGGDVQKKWSNSC